LTERTDTDDRNNDRPGLAYFAQRVIKPGQQLFISYKGGHHKFEFLLDPPKHIYEINGVSHRASPTQKGKRNRQRAIKKKKAPTVAPVVPILEAVKEETEVVYGLNGMPLRKSRAQAQVRLEGLDWSPELPRSSQLGATSAAADPDDDDEEEPKGEAASDHEPFAFDEHTYMLERATVRTCYCGASFHHYRFTVPDQ
jgi:hypothetical protein